MSDCRKGPRLTGHQAGRYSTGDAPRDGVGTLARRNDHDFHYGYIIHAAGALPLRDPAWGTAWKDGANPFVFDVASGTRAPGGLLAFGGHMQPEMRPST